MKIWGRLEEAVRATPFLPLHVQALTGYFLRRGLQQIALSIALGWHIFLRTGELFNLVFRDIWIAADLQSAILHLGWTKGGKRKGEQESIVLQEPGRALRDPLTGCDARTFRQLFTDGVEFIGFDSNSYKP